MAVIAGLQDFRQEGPPADIGTFEMPTGVLVFQHTFSGTTYTCAVRAGERGWVLVDYGTVATTVIQSAITALTPGRTWKEEVVLKGARFTLTQQGALGYCVDIPSLTIFDTTQAELYLANNQDCSMINVGDGATAVTEVELHLGILNGNKTNQTSGHIIYWNYVRRSCIYGGRLLYAKEDGLRIWGAVTPDRFSNENYFENMFIYYPDRYGVFQAYGYDNMFQKIYVQETGEEGVYLVSGSSLWIHSHCHACNQTGGQGAFRIDSDSASNWLYQHHADTNQRHGMYIAGLRNHIIDPLIFENSQGAANVYDGVRIAGGTYNYFKGGRYPATAQQAYAIRETGAADYNEFHTIENIGTCATGMILILGEHDGFDVITVPFVSGTDYNDSGWDIDADAEWAGTWSKLPEMINKVVRMKIYARSMLAEADHMRLEVHVDGGADNEPYNTHASVYANEPSQSVNFAVNDVIYWMITSGAVVALTSGDSVQIKVLHEAVGNGDCATDARFRTVELEYV